MLNLDERRNGAFTNAREGSRKVKIAGIGDDNKIGSSKMYNEIINSLTDVENVNLSKKLDKNIKKSAASSAR